MRLDGNPVRSRVLQQVADNLRDGSLVFGRRAGTLRVGHNHFHGLQVGAAALQRVKNLKGRLAGAFTRSRTITCSTAPNAYLLCTHAHLGANLFETSRHGALISRTAALVGNTALNPKPTPIYLAGAVPPATSQAANIDFTVVPA